MPKHTMKDSDEVRMFADKVEAEHPTGARLLRRAADIMDAPIGTYSSPDDE